MDQLETIATLSIAELRKILSDNEVQDTSKSKEELRSIVSDTLLTKMMIDQLQAESEKEYLESVEFSQSMERSRVSKEQEERDSLLQKQCLEYEDCVQQDLVEDSIVVDEPLSPNSIRQKRLAYYSNK